MSDTWRAIWPYLRRQSRALTIAAGAAVVIAAAEILRPFPLKFVIDHLFQSGDVSGMEFDDVMLLAAVASLVIGIALVEAGAGYVMDLSLVRAGERTTHDLRVAVYAHLQRLSLGFHRRRHAGDLVTRVTGDVNAVGTLISSSAGSLVTAVLTLAGMAVVAFIIDPVLAIVAFATTPVVAVAAIRFRRRVASIQRQQRATEGEIASLATETLGSIEQVRALGTEDFEHGRLEQKSEERRVAGAEGGLVEGRFTRFIDVVSAIGTAIVLVVGVVRVSDGMLSPGDLIVMVAYARRIQRPLRTMARDWVRSSRAMARAERVAELLDTDDHLVDGSGPAPEPGAATSVELEAVTFAYEPSRPIIRDVSLMIPAGSRLALIGRSGAGKSTLAALVARLHDPSGGRVLIGGRDTRDLPLAWMRERIGFVLQDAALFSGSVAENIGWGIDVGRDAVIQAARSAGADEFIQDLPDGYDSQLDPGGAGLSGGQRQRIAIARTLLRDPSILILDEPTRGLDAASERAVLAGLDLLMRDRTTIIITHDRALARLADAVAIIDGGRLERTGPPEDLLGDDDVHTPPATEERAQLAISPAAAPLLGPRS